MHVDDFRYDFESYLTLQGRLLSNSAGVEASLVAAFGPLHGVRSPSTQASRLGVQDAPVAVEGPPSEDEGSEAGTAKPPPARPQPSRSLYVNPNCGCPQLLEEVQAVVDANCRTCDGGQIIGCYWDPDLQKCMCEYQCGDDNASGADCTSRLVRTLNPTTECGSAPTLCGSDQCGSYRCGCDNTVSSSGLGFATAPLSITVDNACRKGGSAFTRGGAIRALRAAWQMLAEHQGAVAQAACLVTEDSIAPCLLGRITGSSGTTAISVVTTATFLELTNSSSVEPFSAAYVASQDIIYVNCSTVRYAPPSAQLSLERVLRGDGGDCDLLNLAKTLLHELVHACGYPYAGQEGACSLPKRIANAFYEIVAARLGGC